MTPQSAVLTDLGAATRLALAPHPAVLTDLGAGARLAAAFHHIIYDIAAILCW